MEKMKVRDLMVPADRFTKISNLGSHLFIMNRHDALFVMENDEIVGLLRFSDIYRKSRDSPGMASPPS